MPRSSGVGTYRAAAGRAVLQGERWAARAGGASRIIRCSQELEAYRMDEMKYAVDAGKTVARASEEKVRDG